MKLWAKLLATFLGAGYFPVAPGTLTSLIIIIWRRFLWPFSLGQEIIFLVGLSFLGFLASEQYSRQKNKPDPREIVVDEACGQLLALVGLPVSNLYLGLAFVLFRGLDIIKPYPVRPTERLKGGWGIMADDLAAGAIARILIQLYLIIF